MLQYLEFISNDSLLLKWSVDLQSEATSSPTACLPVCTFSPLLLTIKPSYNSWLHKTEDSLFNFYLVLTNLKLVIKYVATTAELPINSQTVDCTFFFHIDFFLVPAYIEEYLPKMTIPSFPAKELVTFGRCPWIMKQKKFVIFQGAKKKKKRHLRLDD